MKKTIIMATILILALTITLFGCGAAPSTPAGTKDEIERTKEIGDALANSQSTPTDISYSLERYNLIKRAYWVNGQREVANTLICGVDKPLGYIVLFTANGAVVGSFIVDGKITSLNSFLSPNYTETVKGSMDGGYATINTELPDVDGSYGENDSGIFFFTPDGKYIEWTGTYLYSDIPFIVEDPVVKVGTARE